MKLGTETVIFSLLLLTSAAFAADDPKFSERKERYLKVLDEQIASFQTAKSCYTAATTPDALKHCRDELEKTARKQKASVLDEEIHRLQDERDKLNKTE